MVFARKSEVAETRAPLCEDDLEPRVPPPLAGESTQRNPIGAPTTETQNKKEDEQ